MPVQPGEHPVGSLLVACVLPHAWPVWCLAEGLVFWPQLSFSKAAIVCQNQTGFLLWERKEAPIEDSVPCLSVSARAQSPAILWTPSQVASVQISANYTVRINLLFLYIQLLCYLTDGETAAGNGN